MVVRDDPADTIDNGWINVQLGKQFFCLGRSFGLLVVPAGTAVLYFAIF